ncbi:MAG: hypothetical protein WC496_03185 [Phycisphaerae bacterium]|jgi:chromosome segregation ATPase
MKRFYSLPIIFSLVVFLGCEQAQQKKTAGISRKDRLIASENMDLTKEIAQCRSEIEKQKKLLEQCRQEKEKAFQEANGINSQNLILKNEIEQCRSEIEKQKASLEQCQQMLDLKDVPALCQDKVEKQRKLFEECQQEKEKITQQAGDTAKWFMDELPKDLLKEVETLTNANAILAKEIEELKKASKDANEPEKQ